MITQEELKSSVQSGEVLALKIASWHWSFRTALHMGLGAVLALIVFAFHHAPIFLWTAIGAAILALVLCIIGLIVKRRHPAPPLLTAQVDKPDEC